MAKTKTAKILSWKRRALAAEEQLALAKTALEQVVKLGKVRYSRDRGMPDPTPAFPTHVEFSMGDWTSVIVDAKRVICI